MIGGKRFWVDLRDEPLLLITRGWHLLVQLLQDLDEAPAVHLCVPLKVSKVVAQIEESIDDVA